MSEIEFSVLAQACLHRRNADQNRLEKAFNACASGRNGMEATIDWRFTAKEARTKLRRLCLR